MHVLVIGGAGYIGSHVVYALLKEDHAVTVLDNLRSGLRENLFAEAAFVHGDINDALLLDELLSGGPAARKAGNGSPYQAVVHLAALKAAGESMLEPEHYARCNIGGTINILAAMARNGVGNIVFSSSAAVYGEPQYLPIDELHPTQPTNFYGFTKLEIERLLEWFESLRGIRYAALRYFNAAGHEPSGAITGVESNPANLLPIIMEVAADTRARIEVYGNDYDTADGTGLRDYVHVTDLADAHVRALRHISTGRTSLTVNLGSQNGITVNQMLEAARRITGRAIPSVIAPRRPGDPARLIAGSARARELLGWAPRYSDVDTLISSSWAAYNR
ncbi:MAG: UDP-glucose 4-epimerase GalE [Spirochaetaceae bacterium]|nr:MAG: UDP-glucose 4-epimerase GalE [Spirochaetaceae bacterium]